MPLFETRLVPFRSNSIYKSASAVAALIRVALSHPRRELYVNVSRIESIFHLETLARSIACSNPEKKWLLLLSRLARETVIAVRVPPAQEMFDPVLGKEVRQLWPSSKTALLLRQRLIRALHVYRCAPHFTVGLE